MAQDQAIAVDEAFAGTVAGLLAAERARAEWVAWLHEDARSQYAAARRFLDDPLRPWLHECWAVRWWVAARVQVSAAHSARMARLAMGVRDEAWA